MPSAILGNVAGAVVGGLLSGDQEQTAQSSREPWSAVQPWLKDQIAQGQRLQQYYTDNPFSALQQQAYQNQFDDLNNLRSNIVPGLLDWSGRAMSGGYQRPQYERPGMAGYGPRSAAPQATQQPGSGAGSPQRQPTAQQPAVNFNPAAPAQQAPAATPAPQGPTDWEAFMRQPEQERIAAMLSRSRPAYLTGKSLFDVAPW